ncbi:DNA gyrase subunit A [Candidatus Gromoviella agglomerans]|uniref:DNA gyrase subunit A n=1 Tax=Candidatus Gromoviella agglomerans TaxID=2806609 RepID=UPI001E3C7DF8|nr:DNA gyrase subunit A [Candidatus Gromoviella agglomerans]UFX98226.1 DNA gyrase subunit A [Candidatus Gromoviella agglomerans]
MNFYEFFENIDVHSSYEDEENNQERLVEFENEVTSSYLDYAMSVIVSRALPDVRDGLKPVHRRILYAMQEGGYLHNRAYKKAARIIGDVLGKYHPHGDGSIYDAMVRMAQPFAMMHTLVDGQGNWGSIDGDKAAASRYTEARLTYIAELLCKDYDNYTVDYESNYDNTLTIPSVLPAMFPNLLVNGANGIAVGMATNIPTHNLSEVIDATCLLIDNPSATLFDLLQVLPGPDFPTGGIIVSLRDIENTYRTGRGSIILRARYDIESVSDKKEAIVITEIPYQVNKAKMLEKILDLVQKKEIEGIADMRDESDRHGIRVVIEIKKDFNAERIVSQLFATSQMEVSFSFNMLALNNGKPQQMGLIDILSAFIEFRKEVIQRRTIYFLSKCQARIHILYALMLCIDNIDKIISIIRSSTDYAIALNALMNEKWTLSDELMKFMSLSSLVYKFDEKQARAILDLKLHRLTKLEKNALSDEIKGLLDEIDEYIKILNIPERLMSVMKEELLNIKKMFGVDRKTEISPCLLGINEDFWVQKDDMVVTISLAGYVKRVPLSTYRLQKRGGKGKTGVGLKDEDIVTRMFIANTHSHILFFSSNGKVYKEKVYKLPLVSAQSRGKTIINLLPLEENEVISAILPVAFKDEANQDFGSKYLVFATAKGFVRRNKIEDFENVRITGKIAVKLDANDRLVSVLECSDHSDIMLTTKNGKSIRFSVDEIRVFVGRDSSGVQGIKLIGNDEVVSMCILKSSIDVEGDVESDISHTLGDQLIMSISDHGFGKMTSENAYRRSLRRGQGVMSMKVKNDEFVISTFPVNTNDQIILSTNLGRLIRCKVSDIRISSRNTHGVTICRMIDGERVVSVACLENDDVGDDEVIDSCN